AKVRGWMPKTSSRCPAKLFTISSSQRHTTIVARMRRWRINSFFTVCLINCTREFIMAYTLTDQFRPLRVTMRLNGLVIGLALGLLCLLSPKASLAGWGLYAGGSLWPLRALGGLLLALGILYVLGANQDFINQPLLVSMVVANSLLACVLLIAY